MVYLVPVCLDAQTSKHRAPDSSDITKDSSGLFTNSNVPSPDSHNLSAGSDTLSAGSASLSADSNTLSTGSANPSTDSYKKDEEFEIFLLLFGSIAIGIMLMCIGFGAVVAVVAFMVLAGFISLGIITTSVYIGLRKRSVSKGANAFIMICTSLFGIISGGISTWALNTVYSWTSAGPAIATGVVAGLLGGLILGLFITRILTILINFTDKKLNIIT